MPENFINLGPENTRITSRNLFIKLWLHPRATLRFILTNSPNAHVTQLLMLGGVARAVGRIDYEHPRAASSISNALLLAVLVGGLFGWFTYYAYAWGLSLGGQWLGGRATFNMCRTVVAWALVPTIVSLVPMFLVVDIHSTNSFRREVIDLPLSTETLTYLLTAFELILVMWAISILLAGIRLVQGFSMGRAVVCMLLPGVAILLFVGSISLRMRVFEMATT
ncbi:Yip1 family protein [Hymenobacter psoromatis]|uniref:Yip1 family protein n=1 Tax=Hymenobacter psoromatis TaxID=1484116 RepID=UPI001CC00A00|nr:Yip1 family protein [Hymenobacter psoromatis]